MELRELTENDLPALRRLLQGAFAGGRRLNPGDMAQGEGTVSIGGRHTGVFESGELVAHLNIFDLRVSWDERIAPLGGIGGVACDVAHRGKGHVERLLIESLVAMRESGRFLSALGPFSFEFYRRYGWDWVGEKRHNVVGSRLFRSSPEGRNVVTFEGLDALEAVKPVYAAFARSHRGMNIREGSDPDWWNNNLGNHGNRTTYVHVYYDPASGEPTGYLTFRFPDSGKQASVGDFFALTPAAYTGLLSVLHYYGTQCEKIAWAAPADDPLPLHIMNYEVERKVAPIFMGRVVDVTAALTALPAPPGLTGSATVRVQDSNCDWNNQTFKITVDSGRITVESVRSEPDISTDIQTLSQAYWGQPSLDLLRAAGRVAVSAESAYELLRKLLPPAVTYHCDFF